MLDLFCVPGFNLGPILGFRGTIGAPSIPFSSLEKGCLFLDGTFSISRPCTCFNIDCGHTRRSLDEMGSTRKCVGISCGVPPKNFG